MGKYYGIISVISSLRRVTTAVKAMYKYYGSVFVYFRTTYQILCNYMKYRPTFLSDNSTCCVLVLCNISRKTNHISSE